MADGDCRSFVAYKPCPFCGAELTTRFGPRESDGGRRAFLYCKMDEAAWELDMAGAVADGASYEGAMAAARRAAPPRYGRFTYKPGASSRTR
jgi:hypothetical protein